MLPLLLLAWAEPTARFASAEQSRAAYEKAVAPFFKKHCAACHGPKKAEGELDVLALDPDMKASTSAGRWALLLDKIVTGEMPPATRPRPTDDERRAIAEWVRAELKRAGKNAARREAGGNGNLVPHAVLFDPRNADSVPDAPGRLRRLSPEIYAAYLADTARGLSGVGNPFSPEGKSIFKDTGAPRIDEPVTSQLIRNAVAIASRLKSREIEALLDEKKPLAEPAIAAAIQPQFRRLLGRPATPDEVTRFTALMKKISDEAGRPRGVRHALAAIMLLPEAVYRWETGEGRADERGLARLSPRAIAFGLAYSVGDRRPTDSLLAAKLNTPEEVAAATRRMLDDPKIPRPRLLRFFRE